MSTAPIDRLESLKVSLTNQMIFVIMLVAEIKDRSRMNMYQIMTTRQAMELIKDGDVIGINSFLALANPFALHTALTQRFQETGHPKNLTYFAAAGFGGWDERELGDQPVVAGAVQKVITGHLKSMPGVMRLTRENAIECYCLPLGVLSHATRAAAAGHSVYISKVGLNIFVDPRIDGPGLNERSKDQLVKLIEIGGEEFLAYQVPKLDVAFIRGTTVDGNGNISFENEPVTVDALSMAQATRANGGKVIAQVERVSNTYTRPRNVIIPGALVDAVVVCEDIPPAYQAVPILSGDIHVHPRHMDYWMGKLRGPEKKKMDPKDESADIIGKRAARELKKGDIINIGIGIPEKVGTYASRMGLLQDLTMTVEAGGFGGLPAPGANFGATVGSDMVCDMATQFDFYDGGGLDCCFMGAAEVDAQGNVNAHCLGDVYSGIGGFANITGSTRKIVFCCTFTTKGLAATQQDGKISIHQEGSICKFKREIAGISFSAKNAIANGQQVLYVTERCVLELTPHGLKLREVYDGIDEQRHIRQLLDFEV